MAVEKTAADFLAGKSIIKKALYHHFVDEFMTTGIITVHPAKKMIGISIGIKRIAYITQFGKKFVHILFPFRQQYPDNVCFTKIIQVPGDAKQFNRHFCLLNMKRSAGCIAITLSVCKRSH